MTNLLKWIDEIVAAVRLEAEAASVHRKPVRRSIVTILRTLVTLSLSIALLLAASSAHAEMKPYAQAGAWTASAGTNSDGKPMCMMAATNDIRAVRVKWALAPGLFVHFTKDNWNVPAGSEMPIAIRLDDRETFKGTARRSEKLRANMIEYHIKDAAEAMRFIDRFSAADTMRIAFSGNERDWTFRLDGSDTIAEKFSECIAALKKKQGPVTQPFDPDAKPPQPFDPDAKPPQPLPSVPIAPVRQTKAPPSARGREVPAAGHQPASAGPRERDRKTAEPRRAPVRSAPSNNVMVNCARQAGAWPGPGGWHYYERHIPAINACVSAAVGTGNNQKR
jgi:hypothetical protein